MTDKKNAAKDAFAFAIGDAVEVNVAGEIVAQQRSVHGDTYLVAYKTADGRVRRWHSAEELGA